GALCALPTRGARGTKGCRVAASNGIHTVGAVWGGGKGGGSELVRNCYVNSLRLANEHGIESVAFPSISTGAYRYPIAQAARIAVETVREELSNTTSVDLVRFVCFSAGDFAVYEKLLA